MFDLSSGNSPTLYILQSRVQINLVSYMHSRIIFGDGFLHGGDILSPQPHSSKIQLLDWFCFLFIFPQTSQNHSFCPPWWTLGPPPVTAPWVPPQSATTCPRRKASPYSLQWAFLALTLFARWKPRSVLCLPPSWLDLIKAVNFCISCHQACVSNSWYLTEDRSHCLNFINIDLWAPTCAPPAKHTPANQTQVICLCSKCIYYINKL